jgi:NAD(P)-dependent dehydrogenase (short-subunit alcohol dehydrogenase family)
VRLQGKVALITGAGEGIGRAAAVLFASEGAKVAVLDIDPVRAQETTEMIDGDCVAIGADVSSANDVRRAVDEVIDAFGALNVLYNNAGVWLPDDGPVTELSEEILERTIGVNLTGIFLCCKYAIPQLVRAGGGSIINTSSPVAIRPEPVYDAYTASKGGVIPLTLSIAQWYGRDGVRANVLMPGATVTAMTRDAFADRKMRQAWERSTPLGRPAQPEDIARVALFLASADSAYVTGSIQWADGGWVAMPQTLEPFSASPS